MTLSSAINVALSGIQTSTLKLEQTASNIANAGSAGYSAKRVNTSAAVLGTIGGGVQVDGFSRSEDKALFTTLSSATSDASYRDYQDIYLQKVMNVLGTSSSDDPTLSQALTSFTNSWNILAGTPESLVNQRQVISDATTLCDEVKRIAGEVENLDRQCKTEIESMIADFNSYLQQIQNLNAKISQAQSASLSSGDLEDARDQLILKVAEITEVTVMDRGNGQIGLYTSSGYQLIDGATIRSFFYDGNQVTNAANPGLSLNNVLAGGKLQALVSFRSDTSSSVTQANITTSLTNANTYLTQIETLNTTIAAEQALGNDTTALEATRDTAVTQLNGIFGVNTVDNGDGTINVTTDSGYTLLAGAVKSTFSFDGNDITDALAPTASMNMTLTGGSLEIQMASFRGTASVSTEQATSIIQKLRDQLDTIVRMFTSTVSTAASGSPSFATAYNSSTTEAGNLASGFFTGVDRTTFSVNASLIDGSATLKRTAASAVSNAMLDKTRTFVSDGLTVTGTNYAAFVTASLVSFQQAASNVSTLSDTAETSRAYLQEKHANQTGVNTDTELTNLIEFQNAYSASAHVMSVIKDLFGVLENLL